METLKQKIIIGTMLLGMGGLFYGNARADHKWSNLTQEAAQVWREGTAISAEYAFFDRNGDGNIESGLKYTHGFASPRGGMPPIMVELDSTKANYELARLEMLAQESTDTPGPYGPIIKRLKPATRRR